MEQSLQQWDHLSCTNIFKDLLKNRDVEIRVRQEEFDDIEVKCAENNEKGEEKEKEIARLRNGREDNGVEMEDRRKLCNTQRTKSDEMIRQKDTNVESHLEGMKSLKTNTHVGRMEYRI